jgi:hypothetical protein
MMDWEPRHGEREKSEDSERHRLDVSEQPWPRTALYCAGAGVRLCEVADRVGITERAVQRIVADREEGGYLSHAREGRRNHYVLHADRPFRNPLIAHHDVSLLLNLILAPAEKGEP